MPPVQIFCNHEGPCSEKNIQCKKRFSFVENLSNQPCAYWKQSCHNQKYPDYVYTKQSSEKHWCDLLHDPEIGSHIVLQRDLAQPVNFLRHFYAWSAKEPPLYRAAIKR